MTKNIFVVSRHLGTSKRKNYFHFIGYFNGVRIQQIIVEGGDFDKGEDYVLALKNIRCEENELYGDLIRCKQLFI